MIIIGVLEKLCSVLVKDLNAIYYYIHYMVITHSVGCNYINEALIRYGALCGINLLMNSFLLISSDWEQSL